VSTAVSSAGPASSMGDDASRPQAAKGLPKCNG
jgi:hypothetical protein